MKRDDEIRIDELLAHGRLGAPRHDEILERVLARTAGGAAVWRRRAARLLFPGVAAAAALGSWAIWMRTPTGPERLPEAVRAKGSRREPAMLPGPRPEPAAALPPAAVKIACGPAGRPSCRRGDTLMFAVNTAVNSGYLGAYARRVDDPVAERIWYFPTAAGDAPEVAAGNGTVVLPAGIAIGSEHRAGAYRVTVWLSSRPLARSEVDGARPADGLRGRAALDLAITR